MTLNYVNFNQKGDKIMKLQMQYNLGIVSKNQGLSST